VVGDITFESFLSGLLVGGGHLDFELIKCAIRQVCSMQKNNLKKLYSSKIGER
jgi:hypothetical protein